MSVRDLKHTKGAWIIVDKSNEQLLVEDSKGFELAKPPFLLIFNDYKKANYFLSKSGLSDENENWVVMSVNNQNIWDQLLKKCKLTNIQSGRLNTCVEKDHNCAKLIVLFDDYKLFDKLYDDTTRQNYDHWSTEEKTEKGSKVYVWDWATIDEQ